MVRVDDGAAVTGRLTPAEATELLAEATEIVASRHDMFLKDAAELVAQVRDPISRGLSAHEIADEAIFGEDV